MIAENDEGAFGETIDFNYSRILRIISQTWNRW